MAGSSESWQGIAATIRELYGSGPKSGKDSKAKAGNFILGILTSFSVEALVVVGPQASTMFDDSQKEI